MSSANKKQRHETKRKAKKKETRRREAGSPIKRLADARGEVECWMSEDYEGNRQRQIFVFKRAAGMSGVSCFLVDRGVVGLKDAWSRMDVHAEDREHMLNGGESRGFSMNRVDVEEARNWVAGAARWANDNGMRLPKDWIKCALLIGGAGDWESADVSEFEKKFVGHPEDLRQRLIGESVEAYLKRKDIEFIFDLTAPYMDQETGGYTRDDDDDDDDDFSDLDSLDPDGVERLLRDLPDDAIDKLLDQFTAAANDLVKQTTSWLGARGDTPSSELFEGWRSVMLSGMLTSVAMPDAKGSEIAEFSADLLLGITERVDLDRYDERERAIAQALEHLTAEPQIVGDVILRHGTGGVKRE